MPSWGDRLEIFGLDLRHTPSVEAFCHELVATREAPGLHREQRLPDRPPAAGILCPHAGGRARRVGDAAAAGSRAAGPLRGLAGRAPRASGRDERRARGVRPPAAEPCRHRERRRALAGAAPAGRARRRGSPLSRGASGRGRPAGGSSRAELLAHADGRCAVGRAARGAARERGGAVHPERPAQAAHAAHARAAPSTS